MIQGGSGDISQSMKRANNKVRLGSVRVVATLLSTVLLFGAILFGVAYKLVDDLATSVSSKPSSAQVVAPNASLLNARRLPAILSTEVRIGGLIRTLSDTVQKFPEQSCLVVSVEGQRVAAIRPGSGSRPSRPFRAEGSGRSHLA